MVPLVASDYLFLSLLIPFLILALAAIGLNLLVGYCGQISIGHAAFMAVGAYAAYNLVLRVPQLSFLVVLVLAGLIAAAVGMLFGIPSLRIKGLYLAVATLAAQFFMDWLFARVKWFTNYAHSGSVQTAPVELFGWTIDTPAEKYVFLLAMLILFTVIAHNLVRGHIGRAWMAMRDMDVAAEVIGIRPVYAKLSAFAVSSFYVGVAGALWGFVHLGSWEPLAFNLTLSLNLLFMIIIGGMGSILGSYLRRRLHRRAADPAQPDAADAGHPDVDGDGLAPGIHDLRRPDRVFPDRRAARAWPGCGRSARKSCACGRFRTECAGISVS